MKKNRAKLLRFSPFSLYMERTGARCSDIDEKKEKDMNNKLNIGLANGTTVQTDRGSYVIQKWWNGMWHNLAVFPNTNEGKAMAGLLVEHLDGTAQIVHLPEY